MLMNAGVLVPDEVVIGMISAKLDKNPNAKGFIFDGFPRTEAQAEALDHLLFEKHTSITMMLALEVSDSELTKRLLLRGMESGRPDDQNEGVIRNRIQEYNNKTAPLKAYYTNQGKFRPVNGIGTVEQIFTNLCAVIDPRSAKSVIAFQPSTEKIFVSKMNDEKPVKRETKPVTKAVAKTPVKKVAQKGQEKKKEAPKAQVKKVVKKVAPPKGQAKKAVKKVVKKIAKKKVVPKKKVVKKVVKKVAKKAAPKKKVVKKIVKKAAKKIVKKIAPKGSTKKPTPKKTAKKLVKKKKK